MDYKVHILSSAYMRCALDVRECNVRFDTNAMLKNAARPAKNVFSDTFVIFAHISFDYLESPFLLKMFIFPKIFNNFL